MLGTAFEFEWETSAYVLLNSLVHETHSLQKGSQGNLSFLLPGPAQRFLVS